ncbi:MAG TPA: DUF1697 domain-containing protein [Vicinamibacterales bacterium]|nr:DUF1697 domain-containing protein [Vicinamibacterales bacterium]
MALVAFLRGVNVGGHRTFRPAVLAKQLARFDAINIGAAGTLVIRKPMTVASLRREIARRLPFVTEIMICRGRDVVALAAGNPFEGLSHQSNLVAFVSVVARRAKRLPLPLHLPSERDWGVRVIACRGRFVVGLYRREMRAIRLLGQLDERLGAPVTTRNWNTIQAIARVLG